ncbi:MAG: FAD-dependent thymidylate synthase [Ignavibacteriales bacterium]|nr:FAD-dependent thymidylate synthase [Ignavibacteriales bacterium]
MKNKFDKIKRTSNKELDKIIGKPFKVLNDGFVRLIDYLGSDSAIVQAARVSYGSGTKKTTEDKGLIRYLLRHQHTSPFEMCEIKLHVRVPMDTWRQWIRHRMANVNEYSTRYSIAIDSALETNEDKWRLQAKINKQGSEGFLDRSEGKILTKEEIELHKHLKVVYNKRLELGVAREQARKDLPLSTYTEAYWKIDLHNLLHFLDLRLEKNAQYEIRKYAEIIGNEIVARWCPITWEAFCEYQLGGVTFSITEMKILKEIYLNNKKKVIQIAKEIGWINPEDAKVSRNIERLEFEEKLKMLGVEIKWK